MITGLDRNWIILGFCVLAMIAVPWSLLSKEKEGQGRRDAICHIGFCHHLPTDFLVALPSPIHFWRGAYIALIFNLNLIANKICDRFKVSL